MNLDNARTAQIEILRDIFNYAEIDGIDDGPGKFVDPDYIHLIPKTNTDHRPMRHREPMNIYFNNANTHPLVRLSMVDPISKPTALIAIGISATPGSNTLRLIATYQRRSPDIDSILAKLQHRFPEEIDFLYTGPVRIQNAWHRLRTNTLRPGASIGHVRTTAGTLGCFVRDRSIRLLGVLSNNHILANRNNAKYGDPILQPGRADGGTRVHDTVAALHDYVEILPAPFPNETDCAWASLDTHRTTSPVTSSTARTST